MQTIRFRSKESQVRIARETMDVYVKIADRLCMRDMQTALEGLCLEVLEPELYGLLRTLRTERETTGKTIVRDMADCMTTKHDDVSRCVSMRYEQKSWHKLSEKLKSGTESTTGIATLAVAIICPDIDHCYRMLGALHAEWQREILSFQDFINSPMINGYRGVHTTIILKDGTRIRCKIRTEEMERYAHDGITEFCFNGVAKGPLEYLPWTKRIATIADDTCDHSMGFWEGLQSDILGSTIVVHGPDDRTVMLSTDATALDAAFYLFGDIALNVDTIFMNGRAAALSDKVNNAATITATFNDDPSANLQWLLAAHTGVASAMIRRHLSTAPLHEKIALGRQLFDIAVQKQLRMRLDEIDTTLLERLVEEHMHFDEIDGMFDAIAEGKLDAEDATIALFVHDGKQRRNAGSNNKWVLRATGVKDLEDRVLRAARTYGLEHVTIDERGRMVHVRAIMNLTDERVRSLESTLASFMPLGTWSLRRTAATRALIAAVAVLLALWGLDPVLAHLLLMRGMSPYDLTFVRAVTFFATSLLLYSSQIATSRRTLKWLSPMHPTLLLSGSTLFVTALFSYLALSGIAATTYILCIIMGLLVPVLMRQIFDHIRWQHTAVAFVIIACGAGLSAVILGFSNGTLLAGIGSGLAFALYSELTRRYQHEGAIIRARYPAFLFWMSCVGMVLALFLLPFVHISTISTPMLMTSTLFALAFSVLPYGLYFEISRRMNTSLLDRSLPLVAIITVFGEFILTASLAPLVVIPVIIGFLWHFYNERKSR